MLAPVFIALIVAAIYQPGNAIEEVAPYRTDVAPSNTRDGKNLLLSATDQGLPWPIKNSRDIGQVFAHAPHCMDVIEHIAEGAADEYDQFHLEHCRKLAVNLLKYYTANPDYSVGEHACKAIRGVMDLPKLLKEGNNRLFQQTQQFTSNAEVANMKFSFLKKVAQGNTQNDVMKAILAQNFGEIHFKAWKNEKLTDAEANYVKSWNSEATLEIAALSIYCTTGEGAVPMDKLTAFARCDNMQCNDVGCKCLKN
jgi:hypothetical protein